jgi:amino acid transporter
MASHVTHAGGFYAFVARGFGGNMGAIAAALAILGYNAMQIGLYGLFGVAAAALAHDLFGLSSPWWVWDYVAMVTIAVLGYRQVDLSAKLLMFLVAGEYLVVLLLDVFILKAGGAHGLSGVSFSMPALMSGAPAIGLLFCFASFVGFEATTIYGEEARNPERTIPLATYLSVLLIGGFYTFSAWCLVMGAGADQLVPTLTSLSDPTTFTFILSKQYAGQWLSTAMSVLFVTSVYAALLAFHNSSARYFYSIGREGLLPEFLGRTHPEHQSPHAGSLLQTGLAFAIITVFVALKSDPVLTLFSWLTNLATLCVVTLMAFVSFAVVAFFRRQPADGMGALRVVVLPVLAGALLIGVLILAVANFKVLTGASGFLSWGLPSLLPLAALIGWSRAVLLKRRHPERHARLGGSSPA